MATSVVTYSTLRCRNCGYPLIRPDVLLPEPETSLFLELLLSNDALLASEANK